jgi:hypothetical protein
MLASIMDGLGSRSRCILGALLVALVASGCGSSSGSPTVQVSLIAPTDGATVIESRVYVTGSVQPTDSTVVIAGHASPNHRGHFGMWMPLRRGVSHIRVSARAPGYIATTTEVAVRSTPQPPAHKRNALEQSFPSIGRLRVSSWTPEVQSQATNSCVLHGGWQSYCECALRYAMAAGSPPQVANTTLAARSQRRLPYWLKQAIVLCL